jgi:hypothetical protein
LQDDVHSRSGSPNNTAGYPSVHQEYQAIIIIINMAKNTNAETLCDRELLEKILRIVEKQDKCPTHNRASELRLYDNKAIMEKLNIKDKYLKKLRDNGYLGYSREGDKYWYTQEDLDRFLRRFHYEAFASGLKPLEREGGSYE